MEEIKEKSRNKKLLWVILLILVIILIISVITVIKPKSLNNNSNTVDNFNRDTQQSKIDDTKNTEKVVYQKTELEDGTLYSIDGKKVDADIIVGTNFFDTTINDMYLNPENYANKKIEIDGLYFVNSVYTFVGRYSTSNVCQNCPQGYSYMEYELNGDIDEELIDAESWIKVVGTLAKGIDEDSGFQEYYYLKVLNFQIMNEKGEETVIN